MSKQTGSSVKRSQDIADKVKLDVEKRTGPLSEYIVERCKTEHLHGIYNKLKIRVGGGRYVHIEVYQVAEKEEPVLTGLERNRSATDPLDNIVALVDSL